MDLAILIEPQVQRDVILIGLIATVSKWHYGWCGALTMITSFTYSYFNKQRKM